MPVFQPHNPFLPPLVPICPQSQSYHQQQQLKSAFEGSNTTNTKDDQDILKFLTPFMDMEIQHDHNLFILEEKLRQQIFILHGNLFYELIINGQEKFLMLMGSLEGSIQHVEPLAVEVCLRQ